MGNFNISKCMFYVVLGGCSDDEMYHATQKARIILKFIF